MTHYTHVGRKGPRTRQQRLQELLRKARGATEKYNIGGREKTKGHKPRPITLAKVTCTDGEAEDTNPCPSK